MATSFLISNYKRFVQGVIPPLVNGVLTPITMYTVPTNAQNILKTMFFVGTSFPTTIAFSLYIVPAGGSPALANCIYRQYVVPSNAPVQWAGTQAMNSGDQLMLGMDTVGSITAIINGLELY